MMKMILRSALVLIVTTVLVGCGEGNSEQLPVTLNVSVTEEGGVKLDVSDKSDLETVRSGRLENTTYGLMLVGEAKHRDARINMLIDFQKKSVVAFVSFQSQLKISVVFYVNDMDGKKNTITFIHDGRLPERQHIVYARAVE